MLYKVSNNINEIKNLLVSLKINMGNTLLYHTLMVNMASGYWSIIV
jgi:hypothetical protein